MATGIGRRTAMILAGAALLLALVFGGSRPEAQMLQRFDTGPLTIVTQDGTRHAFTVEVARTPGQRAQGLMFRRTMAPDAGMLFDYRRPQRVAMWMKNTYLSLDMLFIAADGTITRIAERTVPLSLATIESGGRVRGVLELNAGTADRLGITVGDRVLHPIFGTGGEQG